MIPYTHQHNGSQYNLQEAVSTRIPCVPSPSQSQKRAVHQLNGRGHICQKSINGTSVINGTVRQG
jgi:hypothetical protein